VADVGSFGRHAFSRRGILLTLVIPIACTQSQPSSRNWFTYMCRRAFVGEVLLPFPLAYREGGRPYVHTRVKQIKNNAVELF